MSEPIRYRTGPGRWVIAATVLGSGVATLDATVVSIALPAIGHDFAADVSGLQWVVTGYTLTLAGLLLLGGALGDRYGRRRVFSVGIAWFALASLLCGIAPDERVLIVARGLQGVGAALLTPGSLAILQASFRPEDRARAIGAWSGFGGIATAVGPFLGGWLIDAVSWRLIFFINLPVALAVVLIAARHVPESRDPRAKRIDLPGAVLITAGLIGVTYGIIEGPNGTWASPRVLAALGVGAVLLVAFVLVEARAADPMLPLNVFSSNQFSAANAVTFVVYAALGGAFFLLPIQLQQVTRYTPLAAGVALLPVTLLMLALSARSGALATRIGPRLQMSVGPVVMAGGLVLLTRIGPHGGYLATILPGLVVFGLGLAITVAPLTATVLAAAPGNRTGLASAVNNDIARTAGLVAVAVLPALAGITGRAYLEPDRFADGFRTAMLIAAAACLVGALLSVAGIRNPRRPAGPARPESHCPLDAPPLRGQDTAA